MTALFRLRQGDGPIIATAIHDGHLLAPEVAARLALDDATRLREEDPYTGRVAELAPTSIVALRSRFEVDLNRPRKQAVYRTPAEAWGLELWRTPCTEEHVARALAQYDAFYALLARVLRAHAESHGRFVVLDVHSYNHRRDRIPADPAKNPEINIGTGSLDRARWGRLVDRFIEGLSACAVRGHRLDVRANVKFAGGELSHWVHRTFPETGCALAIELKKTFMDEWTGTLDEPHLAELGTAIMTTFPELVRELANA
jgi:N-formylglutamate amidohydrolase